MKILITGGAGYKGVKLTSRLLQKGYELTILDNFMYGFEPILHLVENKKLNVLKTDIRNKIDNIEKFDVIFHLAGISGLPACVANPSSAHLINVEATEKLVRSLGKAQLLIYASTTSFYGKSGSKCTEENPVDPVSYYGKTKYLAEKIVMQRANSISLRFATVFGFSPKMRMDLMVNDFTYKVLKERVIVLFDSYAERTFIHIDFYNFISSSKSDSSGKFWDGSYKSLCLSWDVFKQGKKCRTLLAILGIRRIFSTAFRTFNAIKAVFYWQIGCIMAYRLISQFSER